MTTLNRGSTGEQLTGLPRSTIHDLRTPLTSIRGYAQLLMRGIRTEEQAQRACQTIVRESARLAMMLDQLSKVADVVQGTVSDGSTEFELDDLAAREVERACRRWPDHVFELHRKGDTPVKANSRRVGELLAELLDNAASFSDPGSSIRVTVGSAQSDVFLDVEDHGIGIPADELDAVFECFRRASNVSSAGLHATRGLGVGLFVARAAATQAGGRLRAESAPGVGSVIHLKLPRAE